MCLHSDLGLNLKKKLSQKFTNRLRSSDPSLVTKAEICRLFASFLPDSQGTPFPSDGDVSNWCMITIDLIASEQTAPDYDKFRSDFAVTRVLKQLLEQYMT